MHNSTKALTTKVPAEQVDYYDFLTSFEAWLKLVLLNKAKLYENGQNYSTQAQKLSETIASFLSSGDICKLELIEAYSAQCIIDSWRNNDIDNAKNMAHEVLFVLGNSKKNALILRRMLLDNIHPASTGKKQDGAPLVSVVTPLYNQGEYLAETIQSVRNQSYENWEMIIVNDGSTDNSLEVAQEILNKLNDPKIQLLTHSNKGKGYTRNRGVKAALGKYICVLDSDDQLAPEYLNTAVEILENKPNTGWVTPKTLVYGATHHIAWDIVNANDPGVIQCISPCSAVYRKQIWEELGGYLEDMTDREDWEFWIRAWEAGWGTSPSTDEVLFIYRHAFQRFGTLPHNNINSKLEMIKLHPWWFKPLPQVDVIKECCQHDVGRFNESFLNTDYLAIATQLHKNKEELSNFMAWLKIHWQKLCQATPSNEATNKLRMAIHYLAKENKAKANKYLEQIGNPLEDWQSQLLACVKPLIT